MGHKLEEHAFPVIRYLTLVVFEPLATGSIVYAFLNHSWGIIVGFSIAFAGAILGILRWITG